MSNLQGGMKCVKYLLFFFNFIFWLSGSLVLAVGLWFRFDPDTSALLTQDGAPETFFIGVYILIVAGGLMMLVGFSGCCGAVRESQCLLASFFVCLLVIFGAEIAVGVFGFLNKDKVIEEVQSFYTFSISDNINGTGITTVYHDILNCCGGYKSNPTLCPNPTDMNCPEAIEHFFNNKLIAIAYVGLPVAGVMVIGMIFSMILCCAIRNNREVI